MTTLHAPLTDEQLNALLIDGYLKIPQLLSQEQVTAVSDEMDRLYAIGIRQLPADSDQLRLQVQVNGARVTGERQSLDAPWQIRHIPNCGALSAVLKNVGEQPIFRDLARQVLMTDDMVQLINQLHYKHPNSGVAFAWHQDAQHRGMPAGRFKDVNGRGSYLQIVAAIDPSTQENGGLRFMRGIPDVPGGVLPHVSGGIPDAELPDLEIVTPDLDPGDGVLFGPYTIHGSLENTSDHSRRVFINGFACADSLVTG